MYTINLPDVAQFNLSNARQFVEFWSKYYRDDEKDERDYFPKLKIGENLTDEDVRTLLRWKDPRFMANPNNHVERILARLDDINQFRNGKITQKEIRVFQDGVVWNAFLLHIAKPHANPIVDRYVFQAFKVHKKRPKLEETWETYDAYCEYFKEIADEMRIARKPTIENIRQLKKIDNALVVFGMFLSTYYRHSSADTSARASNA